MPDMNENAETQQEYFGRAKLETDYKDLSIRLYKRIAELEHQLTHRNCLDCSNHSSNLRMRNLDLEKANAELKKQLGMSNKVYNDNLDYSHHIEEQFTKAKVIIKELLSSCFGYNSKTVNYEVKAKAEQFLKE